MNLIQEIFDAAAAKLRTAWGIAGGLLMFISPLVSLVFRGQVPPQYSAILPYAILFTVAALLFLAWLSSYAWHNYFAPGGHISLPQLDTVTYYVSPYSADSDLRTLSGYAHTAFGGDTMSADIVQYAVDSRCAAGLRLTDQTGQNIGFFDVYRLHKDALKKWLDGTLSEPELTETDFEPLAKHQDQQKTLELVVGAIYIDAPTRKKEPSIALDFTEMAQRYLWTVCHGWDEICLYSSIFREEGSRLASLYGFSRSIYMEHRHGAGARHDVWARTLRRSDPPRVVRGLGGRHNVVLEMKYT